MYKCKCSKNLPPGLFLPGGRFLLQGVFDLR
jgi:hypothetical protein